MARAAKAGSTKAAGASGRASGWKWWHGMAAGMLLMLSPGTALLLAALFAPALFAISADTSRGRGLSRSVALFSLAGAIGPVRAYVGLGHDLQAALQVLGGASTVLTAWVSGGFGWLLTELFCLAATSITTLRMAARRKALELLLAETVKEWEIQP